MSTINCEEISKTCRVCLTRSENMFPLESPSSDTLEQNEQLEASPSILQMLEQVMSQKLIMSEVYPRVICGMCKSQLKMSYQLNILFNSSQATLNDMFIKMDVTESENRELIYGNCEFDLEEIIIVKEEVEEEEFLNNLESTVSEPKKGRDKLEDNSVLVEQEEWEHSYAANKLKKDHENSTINRKLEQSTTTTSKLAHHKRKCKRNTNQTINTEVVKSKNDTTKTYKCKFCGTVCTTKNRLAYHKTKCTKNTDLPSCKESILKPGNEKPKFCPPKNEYLCDICGHIAKSSNVAKRHHRAHFNLFKCHICNAEFGYKSVLDAHIKSHKNIRDNLCTICGKTFCHAIALTYHMRMHKKERKYVCEFCGRGFYMQPTWKRHVRTHTDERPYICQYCNKGFRSNGEKKKHEMIHTGEKPYKCRYCEKRAVSSYNMLVHHMSHTGPHKCEHCHRRFIESEFLIRHVKAKHKEQGIVVKKEELENFS